MAPQKQLNTFKPSASNFEFREYPFYWVMRLGNRYTQDMEAQLKKYNMNITTWRIGLILRAHGSISMTEIATHAVSRLPTVTKSVYRMQELGLVDVTQNKVDGRVTMVDITDSGLQIISEVIAKTSKLIDRAFDGLTKDEIDGMNQLLKKVFYNLSS